MTDEYNEKYEMNEDILTMSVQDITDEIVQLENEAKKNYIDSIRWEYIIGALSDSDQIRYELLQKQQKKLRGVKNG